MYGVVGDMFSLDGRSSRGLSAAGLLSTAPVSGIDMVRILVRVLVKATLSLPFRDVN
jgi:hypothetical protein